MIKIQQKIKEIEESLQLIEEGLQVYLEEFRASKLLKDGIYKRLEFCIQNVIDILALIYSAKNLGVPSTLDDIFEGLRRNKALPPKIIILAEKMKGLRNILIHKYGKIDDEIVYELLQEDLDDFEEIITAIEEYLKKPKNGK